ncbi:hypothetical protein EMPS_09249 [Entomortierella parvispora]|uniref:Uncharacterized protein n=1 Tax=Entomortierella parvispora TaxID=205924 RepID=A0A9P3HHN9_9FUNG|nr:hypothetical protein EMPS_09249 [Entomortierella parvispora]
MTQSILLVGRKSYLGHNLWSQLKDSHSFEIYPDNDDKLSENDLKRAFRERVATQGINWILIIPSPNLLCRVKVFQALKEVFSEAVRDGADKLPNVMFFSHVGADEMARKDDRKILAQFFGFEKFLFSTFKDARQAVIVIR